MATQMDNKIHFQRPHINEKQKVAILNNIDIIHDGLIGKHIEGTQRVVPPNMWCLHGPDN